MRVDPGSHQPIFVQIADGVRGAVARGVYRPGEALPSVRALALDLGVNPNTVQRAYEELEREGLVESRRGMGMFVSAKGLDSARAGSAAAVIAGLSDTLGLAKAAAMPADGILKLFRRVLDKVYAKEGRR